MITPMREVTIRDEGPVSRDAVTTLLARWRAAGTEFVTVDERGRHAEELRAGRLDLARSPATLDATWIEATLQRTGYVLLDAHNVSREAMPLVVGRALTAVQLLRTRTGRPEWILVEDAQDVLRRPEIPPHALRLADGGYCLAERGDASLAVPVVTGTAVAFRISQPALEVSLIPPLRTAPQPPPMREIWEIPGSLTGATTESEVRG
jgi:hypothetical protein